MGTIYRAKREFLKLGYKPIEEYDEDDPDRWIQENVLELLEVFSKQGHSGSSAPYVIDCFKKLASHQTLSPLTFSDDEWEDISMYGGEIGYQNNRNSAVFKDNKYDKPYFIDAIVWTNKEDNISYTGSAYYKKNERVGSSQKILKIPFTPKTFYVDVIETEISPGDFKYIIKDEKQLDEVWKLYEKPLSLKERRLKKLQIINEN